MKKGLSAVVLPSMLLAGISCLAAEGMYVKGILKYVMPADPTIDFITTDMDNRYGWGGAIGWGFNQFRVEGEITTQKTDLDAVGIIGDRTPTPEFTILPITLPLNLALTDQ